MRRMTVATDKDVTLAQTGQTRGRAVDLQYSDDAVEVPMFLMDMDTCTCNEVRSIV